MRLNRLRDLYGLRVDDLLPVMAGAALPLVILGGIDARLGEQVFHQLAVSAFQRANENALAGPALPDDVFLAVVDAVVARRGSRLFRTHSTGPCLMMSGAQLLRGWRRNSHSEDKGFIGV